LFVSIKEGGLSALKFLHELNYDLDAIVMDLSMADMDGITLTRHIRQNENLRSKAHPIKIFWYTAWPFDPKNPNDPIVLGANELGVDKIYSKGCDMEQIIYEVKEIVDIKSEPSSEFPAQGDK
jgi:CheY-like chemotaxis protein